ncbi:hypothetical protein I4U23_028932 [Adineta vaga]|nr:hypothetical protein I4U23_028932 [Adineta vaga]
MVQVSSLILIALALVCAIESAAVKKPVAAGEKGCAPVNCHGKTKTCPYGYQKKNGCDICKCHDPCNPQGKAKLCARNERCHVEKKADGTFGTRCDVAQKKGNKGDKGDKDDKHDAKDCQLPKETGPCRAAHPRFYYNSATKTCDTFTYGGCGGNKNNFNTKNGCEKTCIKT